LTPGIAVPGLSLTVEADLLVAGRSTRPVQTGWVPSRQAYDAGSLGAEENARWPLQPTGLRLAGDVLLGETRVRVTF